MTIATVRLYTRPGCHLCEQAEELLGAITAECPLDLDVIDITTDPDLFERFRYEIPVVAVEGGGTVSGRITTDDLRRVLRLSPPSAFAARVHLDARSEHQVPPRKGSD